MRTRVSAAVALALVAFLIAALLPLGAAAQAPSVPVTVLRARLTGGEEVPGPGDPAARPTRPSATAQTLDRSGQRVVQCPDSSQMISR
jgi:hypothetical protein